MRVLRMAYLTCFFLHRECMSVIQALNDCQSQTKHRSEHKQHHTTHTHTHTHTNTDNQQSDAQPAHDTNSLYLRGGDRCGRPPGIASSSTSCSHRPLAGPECVWPSRTMTAFMCVCACVFVCVRVCMGGGGYIYMNACTT